MVKNVNLRKSKVAAHLLISLGLFVKIRLSIDGGGVSQGYGRERMVRGCGSVSRGSGHGKSG